MRARKLTLAALALAAGLSLTACQGNEDSNADANANTHASGGSSSSSKGSSGSSSGGGSSSSSSSSSSSGGNSGGSGSKENAADSAPGSGGGQITTGPCKTSDLAFGTSHGMGEGDLIVRMKNTGGDACSLKGFPGVDLLSQDAGRPLSAKRSGIDAPAVALTPGETTRFTLHYPPNNTGGTGAYVSAIRVTPPDETHSKSLSVSFSLPVRAGADQEVTVDPVGTGKQ
ncbi:DUF4232 domain-containing protein [Streptomyces spirodelae]|uniref:DUF4232 domain-containing protein n=1 Tax=Streptomyces spirodelae TaxID=2812904 RepID=A0ABS3X293_9ACTN|nr:DUF4232 domain-containing protein [Streptomyces spirodelae]MBO8189499.1 DUF4232 domain-containing protein [Streptomyces spirodelae]